MDAVYLQVEMVATMRMDIREDYKISGEVYDIVTTIKDFKTYFYSHTTKEGLDARLSFLDPWAISYLNNLLDIGLELPLPKWLLTPMTEPRFAQYDGYFLFDTEPKEEE